MKLNNVHNYEPLHKLVIAYRIYKNSKQRFEGTIARRAFAVFENSLVNVTAKRRRVIIIIRKTRIEHVQY